MAVQRYEIFLQTLGIDPASLNGGGGASPARGGDKNAAANSKQVIRELEKGNKGSKKGLGATLGIKFGVASLLKQSQVFTGFVGTIFQLFGALVDVILAPFLPILIPGIRVIADLIPYISKYSQAIYNFLDRTLFAWFKGIPISDKIKEAVKSALSAIIVGVVLMKILGVWGVFKSLVNTFLRKPLWALLTKMFPQIDTLLKTFGGKTISQIILSAGKSVIVGAWNATGGKLVTGLKALGDDLVKRIFTNGLKGLWGDALSKLGFLADFARAPFKTLMGVLTAPFKRIFTGGGNLIIKGITDLFHRLPRLLQTQINSLLHGIEEIPKTIGKAITAAVRGMGTLLSDLFKWLPGNLLTRFASTPLYKNALKFVAPKLSLLAKAGGGLLKGLSKVGGISGAAKGFKAVPILGAVAELGFGAYQTYKDTKKYGWKAGMGRAGLTLANTTAALFDPSGIASAGVSIASNIAMTQAYKRMLDPTDAWKRENKDIWVEVFGDYGDRMWQKVQSKNQDLVKGESSGITKERVTTDQ